MPRLFNDHVDENIIFDEEEEVLEMYFIVSGKVGIGYHMYQQPLEKRRYNITLQMGTNMFIGDYYLFNNIKAEFVYVSQCVVEAFAL